MKKAISWILAVCLLLLVTACGAEPSAGKDTSDSPSSAEQEESSASSDASEPSAPSESPSETSEPSENGKEGSVVYFTSDISPEGMLAVFEALGWTPTGSVAVKLPTGDVYACRRVAESKVENVFTDRLADVWVCEMEQYREYDKFVKCRKCELKAWCRGCPAVAKGTNGSFYAADPQCWKDVI